MQDADDMMDYDTLTTVAVQLGRLIGHLEKPHEISWLETKVKEWTFDIIPPNFLNLIQNGRPEALAILAHYLAMFKLLPDTWIYEGLAEHDISSLLPSIRIGSLI